MPSAVAVRAQSEPNPCQQFTIPNLTPWLTNYARLPGKAIRATLNELMQSDGARFGACEDMLLADLVKLEGELLVMRDETLVRLASRGLRAAPFANAEEHASARGRLMATSGDDTAARDAVCHSVAMAWAHHVSSEAREEFLAVSNWTLPLLPVEDTSASTEEGA